MLSRRFSVVRSYCGHGIGELFHCAPNIPHFTHNKVGTTISAQYYMHSKLYALNLLYVDDIHEKVI